MPAPCGRLAVWLTRVLPAISVLASELQYSVVYWNESFDLSSHAFTVREQSRRGTYGGFRVGNTLTELVS